MNDQLFSLYVPASYAYNRSRIFGPFESYQDAMEFASDCLLPNTAFTIMKMIDPDTV